MKKLILFLLVLFIWNAAEARQCIQPIKPIKPIKPIWCTGAWVQILQCDQYCNCEWVPTCINN